MKKFFSLILALALALSLAACGGSGNAADDRSEQQPTGQTGSEQPEEQSEPEEVELHDTIVLSGSGDDVVDVDIPDGYYYVFHITGNAAGRHFAVTTYNSSNEYSELLVNTTEPYDGTTYDASLDVRSIEVKSTGDWTIEVIDLAGWDWMSEGETRTGTGDAVFAISGGRTADIEGNADGRHFAVISYDGYGEYDDLLVNTTEPYSGTVRLGNDATIITVNAASSWSFTLNG